MPTDEWFKENPKVSAYISKELNEKLSEWMQNRNVKKVSQALTTILEEYLGVVQIKPIVQSGESDRIEALEEKVSTLFQMIQELRNTTQSSKPQVVQNELIKVDGQLELLETKVANESTELEPPKASSLPVEESNSTSENQESQLSSLMTTPDIANFLGETHNAISGRHRRGTIFEEKGYRFIPEPQREDKRRNWRVEPL